MLVVPFAAALLSAVFAAGPGTAKPDSETLKRLDPTRIAGSICGGRARGERSRLAWLMSAKMAAAAAATAAPERPVRLLDGLGDPAFRISARNAGAQAFFNQGLVLSYGFNHGEAVRAFRRAQQLDPECAMCWWGEAFALGPNINAPMDPVAGIRAYDASREAERLKGRATPAERALIEAIQLRYASTSEGDRGAADRAYAAAMLDAAKRFPGDDTMAVLAAEAEMDTRPWDYWEADRRTPKGRIGEAIGLVETVLARTPDHPQAAHLYIHLMESSDQPQKAEPAADRLAKPLVPGAGHLVHMPGHLYYRVGRFRDSIRVNVEAARVDEAWLKMSGDNGFYRYAYYPHNVHFIMASAQMAGDPATAIREAKRLGSVMNAEVSAAIPMAQPVEAAPYFAYAQFAAPRTVLALKAPDRRLAYVNGIWRYARATAFARLGDDRGFDREMAALDQIRTRTDFKPMTDSLIPAPDLLLLAEKVARGKRSYARGRFAEAASLYTEAAAIEDRISYMEPPYFYYPVRQSLGAALYRAGDLKGARQAFLGAIAQYPNNGWALYGLAETHRALGEALSEQAARAAFQRAWIGNPAWIGMDRL